MNISAIVLAAGNGKRMGADIPKQFLKVGGEYILTKTLRVFQDSSVISDIVLVTGEEWIEFCHEEIVEKDYSLVPSRYIEFVNRDESVGYEEKMSQLQDELKDLLIQEQKSRQDLLEVMKGLGYEIKF